jgi:hypothetical protein
MPRPASRASPAIVDTVPTTVRCDGSEADWITAAGQSGERPFATSSCMSESSLRTPMKITRVWVAVASFRQSCALSSFCSDSVAVT